MIPVDLNASVGVDIDIDDSNDIADIRVENLILVYSMV